MIIKNCFYKIKNKLIWYLVKNLYRMWSVYTCYKNILFYINTESLDVIYSINYVVVLIYITLSSILNLIFNLYDI
jgi:hypothetical protein